MSPAKCKARQCSAPRPFFVRTDPRGGEGCGLAWTSPDSIRAKRALAAERAEPRLAARLAAFPGPPARLVRSRPTHLISASLIAGPGVDRTCCGLDHISASSHHRLMPGVVERSLLLGRRGPFRRGESSACEKLQRTESEGWFRANAIGGRAGSSLDSAVRHDGTGYGRNRPRLSNRAQRSRVLGHVVTRTVGRRRS